MVLFGRRDDVIVDQLKYRVVAADLSSGDHDDIQIRDDKDRLPITPQRSIRRVGRVDPPLVAVPKPPVRVDLFARRCLDPAA
jgi:hypothetical protein